MRHIPDTFRTEEVFTVSLPPVAVDARQWLLGGPKGCVWLYFWALGLQFVTAELWYGWQTCR